MSRRDLLLQSRDTRSFIVRASRAYARAVKNLKPREVKLILSSRTARQTVSGQLSVLDLQSGQLSGLPTEAVPKPTRRASTIEVPLPKELKKHDAAAAIASAGTVIQVTEREKTAGAA